MLKLININYLIPSKNIRETTNDDDINNLAESIKINGLLSPITVRETDNNKYEIISGHRRFIALKKIGETSVECNIVDNITTEKELKRAQLAENIQRKDMSPFEYVEIFNFIKREYGLSNNELALYLNKSTPWVLDQYSAVEILKHKYGNEENIPKEYKNKSASTIKRWHYNGKSDEKIKYDGDGFMCEKRRHIYKINCSDNDFENELIEFLTKHGMK